jgi:hypothetical protein
MIRRLSLATCALAMIASLSSPARAQLATGNWTPAYSAPLVVQTTQSTMKFTGGGQLYGSNSGELDAAYAYIDASALHVLLTGNIPLAWNIEGQPLWQPVDIFLDTRSGGQNVLLPNNPTVQPYVYDMTKLTGLKFDAGFEADWWFSVGGSFLGFPRVAAVMAELPTAGGGAGTDLGTVLSGQSQPLTGGTNPFGVSVALNDSNTMGVTAGCGAWSGPEIGSGIELIIPLAAIGNPTGCVRVCAFTTWQDHSVLHNQVLGPLPPGTCDLGPASAVDFSSIAGNQWFAVCPGATPAKRSSWGSLKIVYR